MEAFHLIEARPASTIQQEVAPAKRGSKNKRTIHIKQYAIAYLLIKEPCESDYGFPAVICTSHPRGVRV